MNRPKEDFDELVREIYVKVVPDAFWVKISDFLWHYTSIEALFGIIERKEIWLSDYRNLNDKAEIVSQIKTMIDIYNNSTFRNRLIDEIMYSPDGEHLPNLGIDDERIFIFSLSQNQDDLNQWKGYANTKNGISIGFDVIDDDSILYKESDDVYVGKVIYEDEEKKEILFQYFSELKKLTDGYQEYYDEEIEEITIQVGLFLQICSVCFKDIKWKDENEVRIFAIDRNFTDIHYQIKNGCIVPYGVIPIKYETIASLLLLNRDNTEKQMIYEYFVSKNMKQVNIDFSDVDIRFK